MILPSTNIAFSDLNAMLGRASGTALSLNDSWLRRIAGKSSGAISMADFKGRHVLVARMQAAYSVPDTGYLFSGGGGGSFAPDVWGSVQVRSLKTSEAYPDLSLRLYSDPSSSPPPYKMIVMPDSGGERTYLFSSASWSPAVKTFTWTISVGERFVTNEWYWITLIA